MQFVLFHKMNNLISCQNRKEELYNLSEEFLELVKKALEVGVSREIDDNSDELSQDHLEWKRRLVTTETRLKVAEHAVNEMETSYDVEIDRRHMFAGNLINYNEMFIINI